ncbi:hypothetical protein PRZ48_002659 [Zasmidium cellare]|uniref:DUF4211 domain-containing protein n=1 Tax=Zasmidium cellare TaxID=395010 RepID=A0ABR0EV27_ZASCE|nr:hypothetical protein PRZ48_002659 [Zasmidium cellare]
MPSSRASRKKQARLSFTPLPSSSPASKEYNKQIRERAAAVGLEGTPRSSKYRKVRDDDSDLEVLPEDETPTMPTPDASLQKQKAEVVEIDSDDEPIRPSQRAKTKSRVKSARARQQKLDFTNSRDADTFDSPVRLPSSSVRTRSSKPGMFSSQVNGQDFGTSSDEDSAASEDLPSPRKLMEKSKKGRKGKEKRTVVIEDDDAEDEIAVAPRRAPPVQLQESEDDDDDMPTTQGKQPRRRRRSPSADSFISDSPPAAPDSDDEIVVTGQRSRKRARQDTESEEDEDDLPKTPGRRRLQKRPRQMTQQEQEDLAEDLDFFQPSSGEEEAVKPRGSQSAQKNARQQALDKLKRMRSSQLPGVEEEEQDEEDAGEEDQEEPYEEEDEDEAIPQVTRARHMFTRDDEDDDFVEEEDEEGPLGVPEGVPLEFTRYASMKSKELFEFAVEWMVQKKINPAFRMNDPIYELTFKKLDDEVRGLAASKFTSSAWQADFTLALQARPEIAYERIDRNSAEHWMRDKCDACNRSGHPATYQIQFQGKPYSRDTLDPVDNGDENEEDDDDDDDDSDEGSNDENPDWDANGREIVPVSTIWYVGKFCKSNAETAHSLSHWKHHLNGYVEDYLEGHKYCTAEELVKRDKWNTKKRNKYANKVVDKMKADGEVKNLWKLFKDNIDQARNSKQGRYVGDSD